MKNFFLNFLGFGANTPKLSNVWVILWLEVSHNVAKPDHYTLHINKEEALSYFNQEQASDKDISSGYYFVPINFTKKKLASEEVLQSLR